MIKHFFRISLRNMARSKVYSSINIAGLAVGLAGFIVVLLYLNHELNYDKWSPELKKVYKVSLRSDEEVFETTAAPLASFLAGKSSEIETATRIQSGGDYEVPLAAGDTKLYATGSVEVDSNFLKVFPLEIVAGDRVSPLHKPNALILSAALSKKLFGDTDPVGKMVRIYSNIDAEVTAVFSAPSGPSHLDIQFAWLSPWANGNNHWGNMSYETYVKTKNELSVEKLDAAINPLYYNERVKKDDQSYEAFRAAGHTQGLFADAVGSIHNFPRHGATNFKTVAVLVVLAFLLLVAGAINFSNLSIAASIRRAKEVGIRKTLGSSRWQLVRQFLGETALQCLISLVLAVVIAQLALPFFSKSFGIQLSFFGANNLGFILLQILISLVVVIVLSGLYPAVVLSLVNTNKVLKGEYSSGSKGRTLRNGLIVAQFVVAAFFVFAILVINRQIRFMETRDKGFSGQQVVRIEATQNSRDRNFDATRTKLLSVPGVRYVSKSTKVPGDKYADTSTFRFSYAGAQHRLSSVKVSADYFSTLDVKLVKGRLFDDRQTDQQTRSAIINETAARKLGGDNVLGKPVFFEGCDTVPVQVVGIVRDFNVQGLETAVQPMVYTIGNKACMFQSGGALLVKINSDKAAGTIAGLTQIWKSVEPDLPIRYSFIDDNFQRLFAAHVRLQQIISVFAVIAIVISIMGLFAMAAYLTGQRKKEIGVRKVLGASVSNLASLLSRDFIRLVILSVIIAIPIGYWATNHWLDTFAYRIEPGWPLFALAAGLVLLIAIITVSFQTIKAARSNPVDSLRSE
ncbi:ABC transporter permease [Terrimonas sp. NA20]|uniref:ABC transporter permease n=1 Tax=Terrimonas ginsenosidimutans TaxID=2908004 RepID=A0ABS9KKS7_9BACT|nr:ABC transporter permease [Terrimonas ginsenosidimutans]MCG2612923.1 ABC transporter permease [Terrimonas ginsenosidimutans]